MRNKLLTKLSIPFLFLFLVYACGKGGPNKTVEPTPRQGAELSSHTSGVGDTRPSLSFAGTEMVFVRGGQQIFKVSSDIGSTVFKTGPVALMDKGVTSATTGIRSDETQAWISPDGKTVFFTVVDSPNTPNETSLYSVAFDGTKLSEKIATTAGEIPSLVFSSDSKFFAFTKVEGKFGVSPSVSVGAVADPTKVTGTGNSEEERVAFFLNASDLITYSTVPKFNKVTITDIKNISSKEWGTVALPKDSYLLLSDPLSFSLGKEKAFFTQDISAQKLFIAQNGNADGLDKEPKDLSFNLRQEVNTRIASSDLLGNNWVDAKWKDWGSKTISLSLSRADSLGVYVTLERHICKDTKDKTPDGVPSKMLSFADLSKNEFSWFLPVYDEASKTWSLTAGASGDAKVPCNVKSGTTADLNILSAFVNSNASLTSYRVVYVSQFQQKKTQLFFLDLKDGKMTVTPVQ